MQLDLILGLFETSLQMCMIFKNQAQNTVAESFSKYSLSACCVPSTVPAQKVVSRLQDQGPPAPQ